MPCVRSLKTNNDKEISLHELLRTGDIPDLRRDTTPGPQGTMLQTTHSYILIASNSLHIPTMTGSACMD